MTFRACASFWIGHWAGEFVGPHGDRIGTAQAEESVASDRAGAVSDSRRPQPSDPLIEQGGILLHDETDSELTLRS